MIVVYVAGPYTASDAWEREQNIREAEAVAMHLASNRNYPVAVICVHTMSRFAFGHVPEEMAIAADDELLARSDAVVLCSRWGSSSGTRKEIRLAFDLNIPVFDDLVGFYLWAFQGEVTSIIVPNKEGTAFERRGIGPLKTPGDPRSRP